MRPRGNPLIRPAGFAGDDPDSREHRVQGSTLYPAFSVGKGVAATVAALCVDRGLLRYDEPVADRLWPKFGKHGKETMTVADALSHRGGVRVRGEAFPRFRHWLQAFGGDWRGAWASGMRWVEDAVPQWRPGTQAQYHVLSFSFVAGGACASVVCNGPSDSQPRLPHSSARMPRPNPREL